MKISVITPSFNSAKYLKDAIESVLVQNYVNFEHIVIDAASTDGTLEILKSYSHLRWISEPDKGQSDALNKGIEMATGEIVVLLNADDYFLPNAFKQIIPYFGKGALFVVGDVEVISQYGTTKIIHPKTKFIDMLYHWEPWKHLQSNHFSSNFPINPVQYFYKKEIHNNIQFNINNHLTMDLEFLLEVAKNTQFTKIDAVLGTFRMHEATKTVKSMSFEGWDYWTTNTFSYIDNYLYQLNSDEVIQYKNAQMKGYCEQIIQKPKQFTLLMQQLSYIEKLPLLKHPLKKLLSFKKLLSLYRKY